MTHLLLATGPAALMHTWLGLRLALFSAATLSVSRMGAQPLLGLVPSLLKLAETEGMPGREAIAAYAQAALFDLENPKPMYYAALCYLAKGDKMQAASAVRAIEMFCTKKDPKTAPFIEKAAALRAALGPEPFEELKKLEDEGAAKKSGAVA